MDVKLLNELVRAASIYGAAGPVCKLTSTVLKIREDGFLDHSLERSQYRASEMPQAFRSSVIAKAYEQVSVFIKLKGCEKSIS